MTPRIVYGLVVIAMAIALLALILISNFSSQPRPAAARAGGNLASVNPASEVAVRHPLKLQDRVPQ